MVRTETTNVSPMLNRMPDKSRDSINEHKRLSIWKIKDCAEEKFSLITAVIYADCVQQVSLLTLICDTKSLIFINLARMSIFRSTKKISDQVEEKGINRYTPNSSVIIRYLSQKSNSISTGRIPIIRDRR